MSNANQICKHCGGPSTFAIEDDVGNLFCCIGCKSVWSALLASGLNSYYEMREKLSLSGFIPKTEIVVLIVSYVCGFVLRE
jgi:hypothetical protein